MTSHRGRGNAPSSESSSTHAVRACVAHLQSMGYGASDVNERERLHVYASAAGGDVLEAVDMIEEERRAALEKGWERRDAAVRKI